MHIWRARLVLLLWTVGCFNVGTAQTTSTAQAETPTTIDGESHPELISDDLALSVWLLSVGETTGASAEATARMQAKLEAVTLTSDEHSALLKVVVHFTDMRELFKKKEQGFADSNTQLGQEQRLNLGSDQQTLFTQTKAAIFSSLNAQGQQSFVQHLLRVKQHMRVGQGPRM